MNPSKRKKIYRAGLAKGSEIEEVSEQEIPAVEPVVVEQPTPVEETLVTEPVSSKKKKSV